MDEDVAGIICQALHVKWFHFTQETRVYNEDDHVARVICEALERGYRWALAALKRGAKTGAVELRAYDVTAYLLTEVLDLRKEHVKRRASPAYKQVGRLHSSTFQLNVSTFCGIGWVISLPSSKMMWVITCDKLERFIDQNGLS